MSRIRLGTRGSPLAVWQAERIAGQLAAAGLECELVRVTTGGDLDRATPLARLGQPALFSKELDEALIDRRIDIAVHSLKDLPTELPEAIALASVSEREDPRDALIGRGALSWAELPEGATVATCSLRRQAQLRRLRPDLRVIEVRGNIETRLEQLDRNLDWTALVLAVAGLVRLGLGHRIGERLAPSTMLPAPGQGALAVTCRSEDRDIIGLLRRFAHNETVEQATAAERALLSAVEGGCHAPVAAYAEFDPTRSGQLILTARIVSRDGTRTVEGSLSATVTDPESARGLGQRLASLLLGQGAGHIIEEARVAIGAQP